MLNRSLICLVLFSLSMHADFVKAQTSEREAILEVMDKVFAAVRSSSPVDWRAIQLAEGTSLSFRPHGDEQPGKLEMRISNNEKFIADLAPDGHDYVERWTAAPTVLIRGPIAVVWGEYEFLIDGEFSHCGVDAVDLVKMDGEWKVVNFMWTVEKTDCPVAKSP